MNWMVLKLGPGDTQLSLQPRPTSPLQRQKLWVWKTRWEKGEGGQLRDGWEAILHFFTFSLYFSCSTVGGGQWGLPFGVCALRAGGSPPLLEQSPAQHGICPALHGLLAAAPVLPGRLRWTWSKADGASCVVQSITHSLHATEGEDSILGHPCSDVLRSRSLCLR